jgi:hypothetical protein
MGNIRFPAMAILCLCLSGCSLIRNAGRTLFFEPMAFPTNKDSLRTHHRDRQWAEASWKAEMATHPELCRSEEYKRGFEDGFSDYLYAGGTGEPPPIPPRRLWNLDYRTPEGHKAVEDWFAGFRQGACAVREAGYRDFVTVKSSLISCNNSGMPFMPPGIENETPQKEVIPPPRPEESIPKVQTTMASSREPAWIAKKSSPERNELKPVQSQPRKSQGREPSSPPEKPSPERNELKPVQSQPRKSQGREPSPNVKNFGPEQSDVESHVRKTGFFDPASAGTEIKLLTLPIQDFEPEVTMPETAVNKSERKDLEPTGTAPSLSEKKNGVEIVLRPSSSASSRERR